MITLHGLGRDVRYGVRTLTVHRTFSAIAILTIALAVAANAIAFALLRTLLDPLPYGNGRRLVSLAETDDQTATPLTACYATVRDWQVRTASFDSIATWSDAAVRLVRPGGVELVRGMQVSANFFDTLGVRMALGRGFLPGDDTNGAQSVIVLTHDTWITMFGSDPTVVGRVIPTITGPYTVVGVLPVSFHPLHMSNPAETPRMFLPYDSSLVTCRAAQCRRARVVASLRPGVSTSQAQRELQRVARSLTREYPNVYPSGESAVAVPLRAQVVGRFESTAWMIELSVVLLLVLAAANITVLMVARALSRQSEFAVRAALGATRWQVLRQLTAEGLLLAIGGGAAGGAVAWWATRLIARMSDANIPRIAELKPDGAMLVYAIGLSVLVASVAGLAPAATAFRRSFAIVRDASGITPHPHKRTVRALVGVELMLTFVLVTLVGVLGRSYVRVITVDPGFDATGVLTLSLLPAGIRYQSQEQRLAWFDAVVDRMRRVAAVEDAGYASTLPLSHPSAFPLFIREHPAIANAAPVLDTYLVSPNYVSLMRIPLRRGREFAANENARTEPVALVSESAARLYFGGAQHALGQHLQIDERRDSGPWARVVGVVGDVRQYGLDRAPQAAVYLLFAQLKPAPQGWASLVVRSRVRPEQLESAARAAMREVDPAQPVFHVQPMTTYVALSVSQRLFALSLIAAIGALALALAIGGVYGVLSYIVERRTREVGLRLALGASAASIRRLIARQVLIVAAVAIACGVLLAVALGRAISSLLFGVRPLDLPVMRSAAAVVILAALGAGALPIRRATRIDPIVALKGD